MVRGEKLQQLASPNVLLIGAVVMFHRVYIITDFVQQILLRNSDISWRRC